MRVVRAGPPTNEGMACATFHRYEGHNPLAHHTSRDQVLGIPLHPPQRFQTSQHSQRPAPLPGTTRQRNRQGYPTKVLKGELTFHDQGNPITRRGCKVGLQRTSRSCEPCKANPQRRRQRTSRSSRGREPCEDSWTRRKRTANIWRSGASNIARPAPRGAAAVVNELPSDRKKGFFF